MTDRKGSYKVEIKSSANEDLEIRYFNNCHDPSYRSWKMPEAVVKELVAWLKGLKRKKNMNFPINRKTADYEFNMQTEKYIEVREFDTLGRYKLTGWYLPKNVVEELINYV